MTSSKASTESRTAAAGGQGQDSIEQRFDQIAIKLAELEELVQVQFREFDDVLDRCSALLEQSDQLEQVRQQLCDQQLALQQHCETVSAEIANEYEHLRDAWERLEQQQREAALSTNFLQAADPNGGAPQSAAAPIPVSPAPPRPARSPSLTDLDIRDTWTPRMNDAAALQFQQMKRQIRTHTAEHRKKSEN